jgi:hypothetical protein
MRKHTQLFYFVLVVTLIAVKADAQHYMGLATSDYSTMNSIYLNPASIADCKEKVVVNMSCLGFSFDNNLGSFSSFSNIINSSKNSGSQNIFKNAGHEYFSMLLPVLEIRGPGVMISLNDEHKQGFAFTSRVRWFNQFNNFDQRLFNTVSNPNSANGSAYTYTSKKFNWTTQLWKEYGLSYGIMILDDGTSELKAGATLRYLGGIAYLGLKGNNLDVSYNSQGDSFSAKNSDLEFASNLVSANGAYSNGINVSDIVNHLFGAGSGSGLGGDIGVTYIYRIDETGKSSNKVREDDKHKLKISVAITDIGAIKYKSGNNYTVNVTGNGYLTGQGLADNIKKITTLKNYAHKQGYTIDTGAAATKVHMPTALVLSADYQIYKFCYVNATYIGNLVNRQLFGNSYYSQFTITPRVDMKLITVGLPITYSALAGDLKVGLGFRVGGFFFGSDDMLALFSERKKKRRNVRSKNIIKDRTL